MVNTVKAKQTADEMRKKADKIIETANAIELLDKADKFLKSDKGSILLGDGSMRIRIEDISADINSTIANMMSKEFNNNRHEYDDYLKSLLGMEVEPVKRKAKSPSM